MFASIIMWYIFGEKFHRWEREKSRRGEEERQVYDINQHIRLWLMWASLNSFSSATAISC
jgi:hypothetical protein